MDVPDTDESAGGNILQASLSRREIPSLNGLRGVAAMTVVVYHLVQYWHLREFPGYYGVTLFFELSGLLITWLLLSEQDNFGSINRRQFYLRRALRLFPVFYCVWVLWRLAGPFPGDLAFALYMGDYYTALTQSHSGLVAAWSLGVEEKFYFIWPQLLVFCRRRKLVMVLLGVLAAEPLLRWALIASGHLGYTHYAFETNLEPIVLGCLIAVLAKRGWRPPRWLLHPFTLLAAAAAVVLLRMYPDAVVLALGIILVYVVCKPPRILNNPVARFFGAISYSLYLIHPYAIELVFPLLFRPAKMPIWLGAAVQLLFAVGFATVLHFTIERPFLKLKDRFHAQRPTGRRPLQPVVGRLG